MASLLNLVKQAVEIKRKLIMAGLCELQAICRPVLRITVSLESKLWIKLDRLSQVEPFNWSLVDYKRSVIWRSWNRMAASWVTCRWRGFPLENTTEMAKVSEAHFFSPFCHCRVRLCLEVQTGTLQLEHIRLQGSPNYGSSNNSNGYFPSSGSSVHRKAGDLFIEPANRACQSSCS